MVLESSCRRLFSFIPRAVLEGRSLSCDPLPPTTSISFYDDNFFQGIDHISSPRQSRRQQALDQRILAQLLPDAGFRQQFQVSHQTRQPSFQNAYSVYLQDFFNAQPQLAQRFPGGILQFAQMAAQMQPELLEDLMLAQAMDAAPPVGHGGMPGGFADTDDELEDQPEDNVVEVIFNPPPPQQRQAVAPAATMEDVTAVDNSDSEQGDEESENEQEDDDVSVSFFKSFTWIKPGVEY